jgi:hypothetical protein
MRNFNFTILFIALFPICAFSQIEDVNGIELGLEAFGDEIPFKSIPTTKDTSLSLKLRNFQLPFRLKNAVIKGFYQDGSPIFIGNDNAIAGEVLGTNQIYPNSMPQLGVTGLNRTIGIWEVSTPRLSHVEFGGRITQGDNSTEPIDYHATHVAGTLIAKGINPNVRGMSYESKLMAFDHVNDLVEMRNFAANNFRISNHSYSKRIGWDLQEDENGNPFWVWFGNPTVSNTEDWKFGWYSPDAREMDDIVNKNQFYLPVRSAGNDRNEGPNPGTEHYVFQNGSYVLSTEIRNLDGNSNGYDCIKHEAAAKNILTVGAIKAKIDEGIITSNMSSFSGWGPTDDGRIKPDIIAPGVDILSCGDESNTDYIELSGTSMSSPAVAGSLNIILDFVMKLTGFSLRASALKALVIHTAQSYGNDEGPNYQSGWGLMDTKAAVDMIKYHNLDSNSPYRVTSRDSLTNGSIRKRNIYLDGNQEFRATIVWSDIAGTATTENTLNRRSPRLVNDLDLRLINVSDNSIYYPYKLDPLNPEKFATKGDNILDNVEQIYVDNPKKGIYSLEVSHKGNIIGGNQQYFSIMYSGRANYYNSLSGTISGRNSLVVNSQNNYPYLDNTRNTYTIASPNSNPVKLMFDSGIKLENGSDFIEIYDGTSSDDPLIASITGAPNKLDYLASSGKMYIVFTSDESNNFNTWTASYSTNEAPYLTLDKKELLSSSFPFSQTVSIQTNCDWEIKNIPNWITVSKISGSTSVAVEISWTQNNAASTRVAILEIHGCNGLKETITVTQYGCTAPFVPIITANKSSICIGETATLTVTNPCNDCQYIWSNNSTGISITVNQGGKYMVTASNTCTSLQSSEVEITSKSLPTKPVTSLVGTIKICDGSSITISVNNVCNGCTIKWSTGETTSSINLNATGTYHVAFINDCGEGQKSDNIIVEKETYIPTIVVNDLCYLAGPNGGLSYQWQLNGIDITGATLQFYVALQNGYYTLKAVRSDNCSGISEPKFISGCTSTVEDNIESNIFISPNPFSDELVIHLSNSLDNKTESNLYAINGQLIKSAKSVGGIIRYDTQELPKGAYIVKIFINQQIKQFRIIKI